MSWRFDKGAIQSVTNQLSIAHIMDLNVFKVPINILKGLGLWQNKNASRFYAVYGILMHFIYIGLSTLFQLLYVIEITTTDQLLIFLIYCPTFIEIFIKSLVFVAKVDAIEKLLTSMKELIAKINFIEKYKRQTRFIGRFFKIYLGFCFTANMLGMYTSFTLQELQYKMWLPFDIHQNSLTFFLAATITNITTFGFIAVGVCLNIFADFFMNHAVILLDDLCERFENLNSTDKKNDVKVENRKRFLQLIDEHRKIKQLIQKIANIFNLFWLAEGLTCSIVLCALLYSISTVSSANLFNCN